MITKSQFYDWCTGRAPHKSYQISMLILFFGLILMFILSAALYPGGYSIVTHEISDLGSAKNPIGQWLFRPYFVIFGLLMIPHALYLYRCLYPDVLWGSRISIASLIGGMIGMMGVGIFPSDPATHTIHVTSAGIEIVGMALNIIFALHPLIKKMILKRPWPNPIWTLITFTLISVASLAAVFLVGLPLLKNYFTGSYPAWFLCEWSIFMGAIVWIMGLVLMAVPPKLQAI